MNAVGYQFPWDDGTWATVTRSYNVHGTGRIDFDLSGRDVAAAKDGMIVYANDSHSTNAYASAAWWYWNTVVIQHADHEFSLYGHLAQTSIPQWIKDGCTTDLSVSNCAVPVKAGQIIAQEGSTGYSSNPHLHLEFGQAFGIAAYMDSARRRPRRQSRRSRLLPPTSTPSRTSASAATLLTKSAPGRSARSSRPFTPRPLPATSSLLRNGDFSAGTDGMDAIWSIELVGAGRRAALHRACARPPRPIGRRSTRISTTVYDAHTPFEVDAAIGQYQWYCQDGDRFSF